MRHRPNYQTPSFKRHNLVNIQFIYMKIDRCKIRICGYYRRVLALTKAEVTGRGRLTGGR